MTELKQKNLELSGKIEKMIEKETSRSKNVQQGVLQSQMATSLQSNQSYIDNLMQLSKGRTTISASVQSEALRDLNTKLEVLREQKLKLE